MVAVGDSQLQADTQNQESKQPREGLYDIGMTGHIPASESEAVAQSVLLSGRSTEVQLGTSLATCCNHLGGR